MNDLWKVELDDLDLLALEDGLTEWEVKFVNSLHKQLNECGNLTNNQRNSIHRIWIHRIWNKVDKDDFYESHGQGQQNTKTLQAQTGKESGQLPTPHLVGTQRPQEKVQSRLCRTGRVNEGCHLSLYDGLLKCLLTSNGSVKSTAYHT